MATIATRRAPATQGRRRDVRSRQSTTRSTFDIYLDDAGGYDLLSAEQEREKLVQIVELRRERWRALLTSPAAEAVRRWILSTQADNAQPEEAVALLRKFWTGSRGSAALGEENTMQVDAIDLDGVLADRLEAVVTAAAHTAARDRDPESVRVPAVEIGARLRRARNRFACSNLRLVVRIAARHADERMSLADRVQEGNLGLLMAVSRFDPERGCRFSTYAAWWIRFAITRALVNRGRSVRIPAHLHAIFGKARRAEQTLRGQLGREPTIEEISVATEIPLDKLVDARAAMEARVIALEEPDGDDGAYGPASFASYTMPDRDAVIDDRRNLAIARGAFDALDPMERDIIEQRFGLRGSEVMTLSMLGERYALSRERIRQLQNRALDKLRVALEASPVGATAYA
ncbi:MAG: RNA polymerase sigma factor RpoD/SigA [Deltaproteobacteria bacterium]|nr:RNA polymerase sigma factor RpoD/SigA [Nannocystaceae bacterium]